MSDDTTQSARRKFGDWARLADEADFNDDAVYRWWVVNMLVQIFGALDSIAYIARVQSGVTSGKKKAGPPRASSPRNVPARQGGSRGAGGR